MIFPNEAIVPSGSSIFQYPYVAFPEEGTYEPVITFIHSKVLLSNFGGMRGREGNLFYRKLNKEPLDQQLSYSEIIKRADYSVLKNDV